MFTPTLRCECAQPASDRLMRKWCIRLSTRGIQKVNIRDTFLYVANCCCSLLLCQNISY